MTVSAIICDEDIEVLVVSIFHYKLSMTVTFNTLLYIQLIMLNVSLVMTTVVDNVLSVPNDVVDDK